MLLNATRTPSQPTGENDMPLQISKGFKDILTRDV
jgi:hypothetical protein